MGLFDKKYCSICNERIKLLGEKKLSDGSLCKDCERKLSPWFSERRQSTVEEIRGQLEYREANRDAAAAFHTTRSFGEGTKLLIDEDQSKFTVTSARNLAEANPDILDLSQITGCTMKVSDSKSEIKTKDAEGNSISYDPPQYKYSYDFYITINVNHPYFDDMRFRVNSSSVYVSPEIRLAPVHTPNRVPGHAPGMARGAGAGAAVNGGLQRIAKAPASAPAPQAPVPAVNNRVMPDPNFNPLNDPSYINYENMCREIIALLTNTRQEIREQKEFVPQAVVCPYCGATTVPDSAGCCEYCGGAVNG